MLNFVISSVPADGLALIDDKEWALYIYREGTIR